MGEDMSRTQDQRQRVAELLADMQEGAWTVDGLAEAHDLGVDSVRGWLRALSAAGLVREVQDAGTQRKVWEWVR